MSLEACLKAKVLLLISAGLAARLTLLAEEKYLRE